jgi:nitrate reductase beta subunit
MDKDTADAIFRLTSLPLFDQRVVIPPAHREEAMEMLESTADVKGNTGFGFKEPPERGL